LIGELQLTSLFASDNIPFSESDYSLVGLRSMGKTEEERDEVNICSFSRER
jgi:hypothetical protein